MKERVLLLTLEGTLVAGRACRYEDSQVWPLTPDINQAFSPPHAQEHFPFFSPSVEPEMMVTGWQSQKLCQLASLHVQNCPWTSYQVFLISVSSSVSAAATLKDLRGLWRTPEGPEGAHPDVRRVLTLVLEKDWKESLSVLRSQLWRLVSVLPIMTLPGFSLQPHSNTIPAPPLLLNPVTPDGKLRSPPDPGVFDFELLSER